MDSKVEGFRATPEQQKRLADFAEKYAGGTKSTIIQRLIDNAEERGGILVSHVAPEHKQATQRGRAA